MATREPDAPSVGGRRASHVKALVKGLLAVVAIVVIARKVDLPDMAVRLQRLGVADVATLLVLYALQTAVGAVRWWRLLCALRERVPLLAIFRDVLVGVTFNLFLPTGVGGDVVRALRARRRVTASHHAWSTSIFERIAGLVAMGVMGGVAATVGIGADSAIPWTLRASSAGFALAVAVAFFVASTPFRILVRILERHLPAPAMADMRGIVSDLEGPLATARVRLEALSWSVFGQALALLFVIVGASALGAPGHELAIVIGIPLVFVLSMVPLTLGGHGLREGLYVAILGALGVPTGVALGLAATFLAASVVFGAVGAAVLVFETPPAPDSPSPARGPN